MPQRCANNLGLGRIRKGFDLSNPTCSVADCSKPARSKSATLCPMHYHREYRHGSVHAKPQSLKTGTPRRYKSIYVPSHPLAGKHGNAYVHRVVLFDEIGPGPHECHWCAAVVEWLPKGSPGMLVVDHVNEDKGDNRVENLVPCCLSCNSARSAARRSRELASVGAWSVNDTIAGLRGGRAINRFA